MQRGGSTKPHLIFGQDCMGISQVSNRYRCRCPPGCHFFRKRCICTSHKRIQPLRCNRFAAESSWMTRCSTNWLLHSHLWAKLAARALGFGLGLDRDRNRPFVVGIVLAHIALGHTFGHPTIDVSQHLCERLLHIGTVQRRGLNEGHVLARAEVLQAGADESLRVAHMHAGAHRHEAGTRKNSSDGRAVLTDNLFKSVVLSSQGSNQKQEAS